MPNDKTDHQLLHDLYNSLDSKKFEKFISSLLEKMDFSDPRVTGGPGDAGIDLTAEWQDNVPGLDLNFKFKIQAKLYDPEKTINPKVIRELRGSLASGERGLLITTAKVSKQAKSDAFDSDPSRIIQIIDGETLIDVCKKLSFGVTPKEYSIDLGSINWEEIPAPVEKENVGTLEKFIPPSYEQEPVELIPVENVLKKIFKEDFIQSGNTPIYKSPSQIVIARISKLYEKPKPSYWYGIKAKDQERLQQYDIPKYIFVMGDSGAVVFTSGEIIDAINRGLLDKSEDNGRLRHYHMRIFTENRKIFWKRKDRDEDITLKFIPIK